MRRISRRLVHRDFQELEERERNLYASQGRTEITLQGLQRDVKYHEDKVRECEKKIRQLEHNISEEIQLKERARLNLQVPYERSAPCALDLDIDSRFSRVRRIQPLRLYITVFFPPSTGFRTETGTRVERRVLRDGASQSGDCDPQGRGARAGSQPTADEEHECRGAVDRRRSGFPNLQGRPRSRHHGEGAAAEAAVRSAGRHRAFTSGTTIRILFIDFSSKVNFKVKSTLPIER